MIKNEHAACSGWSRACCHERNVGLFVHFIDGAVLRKDTRLKCLLIFLLWREKREAEMITANKSASEPNSPFHNSVENMVNESPITEEIEALCS